MISISPFLNVTDAVACFNEINNWMIQEAKNLNEVLTCLHEKHKEYADKIQNYIQYHSVDQAQIKRLAGLSNMHFCYPLFQWCEKAKIYMYYHLME